MFKQISGVAILVENADIAQCDDAAWTQTACCSTKCRPQRGDKISHFSAVLLHGRFLFVCFYDARFDTESHRTVG